MVCKSQKAFSSIEILVLLIFISTVALGTYSVVNQYKKRISIQQREQEAKTQFENLRSKILSELTNDMTPEVDSPFDSFYSFNGATIDGMKVTIQDLSAKININFFPAELIDNTALAGQLKLHAPFSYLEEKIQSTGLLYTYDDVSDVMDEEVYNEFCSPYGIACFNSASDLGFEKLIESVSKNNASAQYLTQKKRELNKNKQMIQNENELKLICGVGYDEIHPYILLEQPMNVHFVDEEIIKAVLSYPKFNFTGWKAKCDTLLTLRTMKELTVEDIKNCLGITESSPLFYYFGLKTWFWQIELISDAYTYTTVVFRYPEMTLKNKTSFFIINQKWTRNEKQQ